jgi:conjugative transfer signal peptidase TraF
LAWAWIAIPTLAYALGLRVNISCSLPMGLYVVTGDARSALIEFCPEGAYATESKLRGYRRAGSCPDGAAPLIKQVAARTGDLVEMSARGLSVNGKLLRNSAPLVLDGKGQRLTPYRFGRYSVSPDEVWVVSTYSHGSYDSRYFGPIRVASIRNRLRPVCTLHP